MDKKRFHIALDGKTFERLKEIKKTHGLSSITQTVRKAISFMYWYVEKKQEGYRLCLKRDDKISEVLMPD